MVSLKQHAQEVAGIMVEATRDGRNPLVLIDGLSGSGKTSFASLVTNSYFAIEHSKPQLIHMDDLYPGWEGLRQGSNILVSELLMNFRQGKPGSYQVWDWEAGRRGNPLEPGNGWRTIQPNLPLVVEGCGSISAESKRLSDLAIWISSADENRKKRLAARDQGRFLAFQANWAAQEDEFYSREHSYELADLVIDN